MHFSKCLFFNRRDDRNMVTGDYVGAGGKWANSMILTFKV